MTRKTRRRMRIIFITAIIVTPVVGATVAFTGSTAAATGTSNGDASNVVTGYSESGQVVTFDTTIEDADDGGVTFTVDLKDDGTLPAAVAVSNPQVELSGSGASAVSVSSTSLTAAGGNTDGSVTFDLADAGGAGNHDVTVELTLTHDLNGGTTATGLTYQIDEGATAGATPATFDVQEQIGDQQLDSGATFWDGQGTAFVIPSTVDGTAFTETEQIQIRQYNPDDNEIGPLVDEYDISSQSSTVDTDGLSGDYVVVPADSSSNAFVFENGVATDLVSSSNLASTATEFEVVTENFDVGFVDADGDTVESINQDGTTFLSTSSNRGRYDLVVSSNGALKDDVLKNIFDDNTNLPPGVSVTTTTGSYEKDYDIKDDSSIVVKDVSDLYGSDYELDFNNVDLGIYNFDFIVTDTGVSASDDIYIENESVQPQIEYDFKIPNNGDVYTIGFPAPLNGTLADALNADNQNIGSETTIYVFESGEWVNKNIENIEPDALDAVVIVTDGSSGENTININMDLESTEVATPSEVTVTEGWNYVSAPAFENADTVFDVGNAREVFNPFNRASPSRSDISPANEFLNHRFSTGGSVTVSPFHGYFVYVEDDSGIQTGLAGGTIDQRQTDKYLNID